MLLPPNFQIKIFDSSVGLEGFCNDKKTHRHKSALIKAYTRLCGKSDYDLRLHHQTFRRICDLPGYDVCGFFVSQKEKLVLGIRNTIAFNHAPNARQSAFVKSEKTYMRIAELPRQIFLLFCCNLCCSVHSSIIDNGFNPFQYAYNMTLND